MSKIMTYVWGKRSLVTRGMVRVAKCMLACYRRIPLSRNTRIIIKDMVFGFLYRFIFMRGSFQQWARNATGTNRIVHLLSKETMHRPSAVMPPAPSDAMWQSLTPASDTAGAVVDVIIPVYKGYDDTLNCIYTVLSNTLVTPYELIVINDAGPDAALVEKLRALAARGLFTLIENPENKGFVATVNRGMKLHPQRDVVLLNSDTEVYNDWLDRLRAQAYALPNVASVTPFSNNAEICSYPLFVEDNYYAMEIPFGQVDALAAVANKGKNCALPTGVGFCMYMPRAAMDAIGYFDEETFGRGYGEENDFCQRAIQKNYVNLLAADCFVRHLGGRSFEGEKQARIDNAVRILNRKYPSYSESVHRFVIEDSPRPFRAAMDAARLKKTGTKANILFVTHILGGGTEKHVLDMAARMQSDGIGVYALRPSPVDNHVISLNSVSGNMILPNLVFDVRTQWHEFCEALSQLGITLIHLHHTIGFANDFLEYLQAAAAEKNIPYDVTLHDYFSVCPRINLMNAQDLYCGEPAIAVCEQCVTESVSYAGGLPVWKWRYRFGLLLAGARHVYVPSADMATRMQKYFPDIDFMVRVHMEEPANGLCEHIPHVQKETLRVAVIGGLAANKGSLIIEAMAKNAAQRKLPIEFYVIGDSTIADSLKKIGNVQVHGRYREGEVYSLLAQKRCHVALFASVWPETYCYTLSIALKAKLFPVAFDIGAPADRIRDIGWGSVLPFAMAQNAAAANDALLALSITPPPADLHLKTGEELYPDMLRDYYGLGA